MNQSPNSTDEPEELVAPSEEQQDPSGVIDLAALRELDEIAPGAAKAFVENLFAEAAHARKLEQEQAVHERALERARAEHECKLQEKNLETDEYFRYQANDREKERNRMRRSGQLISGLIASLALVVVGIASWTGSALAPLALVIIATAMLAGTVAGNRQQSKELHAQIDSLSRVIQKLSPSSSKAAKELEGRDASGTHELPASSGTDEGRQQERRESQGRSSQS